MSLLEVMVAVVILAVALLALVGVEIFSLRASTGNEMHQRAILDAEARISSLQEGLANPVSPRSTQLQAMAPAGRLAMDDPAAQFTYAVSLSPGAEQAGPVLRRLQVDVYWTDAQGEHTYSVWTRFYDEAGF